MTNEERLDKIIDLVFKYENRSHLLVSPKDVNDILDCKKTILQDLETLEMLLFCFKSAILDATNPSYRKGDNIIADLLKDKLGLIKLNELKRRLENDK